MTRERFIEYVRTEQEPLRRFLLALCNGDAALADDLSLVVSTGNRPAFNNR